MNDYEETRENLQLSHEHLLNRLPTLATTLLESLRKEPDAADSEKPSSLIEQIRKEFLESLLESSKTLTSQEKSQTDPTNQTTPSISATPDSIENTDSLSSTQEAPQSAIHHQTTNI